MLPKTVGMFGVSQVYRRRVNRFDSLPREIIRLEGEHLLDAMRWRHSKIALSNRATLSTATV